MKMMRGLNRRLRRRGGGKRAGPRRQGGRAKMRRAKHEGRNGFNGGARGWSTGGEGSETGKLETPSAERVEGRDRVMGHKG